MIGFIAHLFYPRYSNNQRPKILHLTSIFALVVLLFFSSLSLSVIKSENPKVLGAYSDINFQDLLVLTNLARSEQNIPPLAINPRLSQAAWRKADDMFANNYWAHDSPSGKTPWDFIKDAGYDYVYAGENLARGFSSSSDVISAWLASPEHRDNMLSRNFSDVGFAVKEGSLNGESTTLVVEELGGTKVIAPQGKVETLSTKDTPPPSVNLINENQNPKINSISLSTNLTELIIIIFIGTFILDLVIVERKKVVRLVGHNIDHILFLTVVLVCILVLSRGVIL